MGVPATSRGQPYPMFVMSIPSTGISTPTTGDMWASMASVGVLSSWNQLPASPLEDLERLEQLRLIELANDRYLSR